MVKLNSQTGATLPVILLLFISNLSLSQDEVIKLESGKNYLVMSKAPDVYQGSQKSGVAIQGAIIEVTHQRGPWRYSKSVKGWIHKKELMSLEDAAAELSKQIEEDPTPIKYHLRGIVYMAEENWGRAVNDLEEAYQLGESSVSLHINLGTSLLNLGLTDKALAEFTHVIENYPEEAVAYQSRGDLFLDQGNYEAALKDLRTAAKYAPQSAETYNSIGVTLRMQGEFAEAIKAYDQAIEFDPSDMSAYVNRGYAHKSQGDFGKALKDYEKALELEPDSPSAMNDLAWLLATCSDKKIRDGRSALELALKACRAVEYRMADYVDTLAAAYAANGNYNKAIETAETACSMLENKSEKAACEEKLKLYRMNKPFVETMSVR